MCIADRHDMNLAVKVALNPNTTNQSFWECPWARHLPSTGETWEINEHLSCLCDMTEIVLKAEQNNIQSIDQSVI